MMRSMYSAVSSLKAHQLKMDVIGNNIANVNTTGFKGSRVAFHEVFSQTLRGAGRPQENGRGGTNPQQVGLGMDVSSMDTFHMRGSVESTGYNTDLMINGDGFFIVSDTESGLNKSYTRAGNFNVDEAGNLLTADGFYVLGYRYDDEGKAIEDLTSLQISKAETVPPMATTEAIFEGNIDSRLPLPVNDEDDDDGEDGEKPGGNFSTTMKVYDSLGNAHNVEVAFVRIEDKDDNRQFDVYITKVDDCPVQETGETPDPPVDPPGKNIGTLEFDTSGQLTKDDDSGKKIVTITIKDGTEDPPNPSVSLTTETGGGNDGTFQGAKALTFVLDFTNLKSYAAQSDAAALSVNGCPSGKLDDFTISSTGEIEAVFSNGQTKILGRVGLANFKNPAGLLREGSNMYRETANSGIPIPGLPATGGFANLQPGSLEMSNVDLAREFTDMITTQRGFQANSRVISVSDEMLQELVNMKR